MSKRLGVRWSVVAAAIVQSRKLGPWPGKSPKVLLLQESDMAGVAQAAHSASSEQGAQWGRAVPRGESLEREILCKR